MSDDTASVPADISYGDTIAGYRLEEQIGRGGMAVVYRAHHERLDRRVALKVLAPTLAADTAFRTRFIRESRAAAAVDHPNIIPVYDAGDAGGFLFISMRYVQGGDVRSLLAGGSALAPARAWNIISQVAAALDAAHERDLVHRDVKPANMLLDASSRSSAPRYGDRSDDVPDHVYLSDFGISKRTLASNLTSTGQFVGTLDYIAPEQIEGRPVDGRADQYSLACAAFELLCGAPPFRRSAGLALINAHLTEPPPSLVASRPGLPQNVDVVIAKAMAKSAAERYATCVVFAADLGRALGLLPGSLEAGAVAPASPGPAPGGSAMPTKLADTPAAHAPGHLAPGSARPAPGPANAATTPPDQWPGGVAAPETLAEAARARENSGPSGPAAPGWPPGVPVRPAGRSRGLIAGAVSTLAIAGTAVAVTIAVVGARNAHGSPDPNSSTGTLSPMAQAQASAIGKLLSSSEATRGKLASAVNDIQYSCSPGARLSSDISAIQAVAMQRQTEYSTALNLRTSALPNGRQLRTDLLDALRYSLNADDDYLQWAQQEQQSGCSASNSSASSAAGVADGQANTAKASFASLWDSIAASYGQQPVSQTEL